MTMEYARRVYAAQFEQIQACFVVVNEEIRENFATVKNSVEAELRSIGFGRLTMQAAEELMCQTMIEETGKLEQEMLSRFRWRASLNDNQNVSAFITGDNQQELVQALEMELTQILLKVLIESEMEPSYLEGGTHTPDGGQN